MSFRVKNLKCLWIDIRDFSLIQLRIWPFDLDIDSSVDKKCVEYVVASLCRTWRRRYRSRKRIDFVDFRAWWPTHFACQRLDRGDSDEKFERYSPSRTTRGGIPIARRNIRRQQSGRPSRSSVRNNWPAAAPFVSSRSVSSVTLRLTTANLRIQNAIT